MFNETQAKIESKRLPAIKCVPHFSLHTSCLAALEKTVSSRESGLATKRTKTFRTVGYHLSTRTTRPSGESFSQVSFQSTADATSLSSMIFTSFELRRRMAEPDVYVAFVIIRNRRTIGRAARNDLSFLSRHRDGLDDGEAFASPTDDWVMCLMPLTLSRTGEPEGEKVVGSPHSITVFDSRKTFSKQPRWPIKQTD